MTVVFIPEPLNAAEMFWMAVWTAVKSLSNVVSSVAWPLSVVCSPLRSSIGREAMETSLLITCLQLLGIGADPGKVIGGVNQCCQYYWYRAGCIDGRASSGCSRSKVCC